MIEERGRVVSVESGAAWVETIRRSTCGSCQARAGCGQALLERLGSGARRGFIRVIAAHPVEVGDEVIIGLPEDAVLKASALMYVLPLLMLFFFTGLADLAGLAEPWIIAIALAALALGFFLAGWHSHNKRASPQYQARILRRLPTGSAQALQIHGSF
ncbi:MAG: SoxR reducing system RseC family protein [Pseudomonas sp.]|nr:SoxR reducing system RseC family protein [Pseudomonas sp.]